MSKPLVSVVMAYHNEPEAYVRQAIESILNQSFKDFEFIIVIDTPASKLIEDLVAEYTDKRIITIQHSKSKGLAASLNAGIAKSSGTYIARMDADDISLKNRLQLQVAFAKKNPSVDIVFGWVDGIDQSGKKTFEKHLSSSKITASDVLRGHGLVHPSVFGKATVFKDNPYAVSFMRAQDFNLWLSLYPTYSFAMLKKVVLHYRFVTASIDTRIAKLRSGAKYRMVALVRHLRQYAGYPVYWLELVKVLCLRTTLLLPRFVLRSLVKIKDFLR